MDEVRQPAGERAVLRPLIGVPYVGHVPLQVGQRRRVVLPDGHYGRRQMPVVVEGRTQGGNGLSPRLLRPVEQTGLANEVTQRDIERLGYSSNDGQAVQLGPIRLDLAQPFSGLADQSS